MPVCNKCNIEKSIEEYSKEFRNGKTYYKKYCTECFRKQARDWKLRNKLIKTQQEPVPTPEPIIPDGYKQCSDCNEIKSIDTDYYKSSLNKPYKNCKKCYLKRNREGILDNQKVNGGSERVCYYPNMYTDEYQKEQTFWLMELLGWKFNKNGVWSKEGVKDKNKKWYIFEESPKKPKRNVSNNTGRKFAGVHKHTDEVILKHKEGLDFYELADIYECSHTTIRKIVKEYNERSH